MAISAYMPPSTSPARTMSIRSDMTDAHSQPSMAGLAQSSAPVHHVLSPYRDSALDARHTAGHDALRD